MRRNSHSSSLPPLKRLHFATTRRAVSDLARASTDRRAITYPRRVLCLVAGLVFGLPLGLLACRPLDEGRTGESPARNTDDRRSNDVGLLAGLEPNVVQRPIARAEGIGVRTSNVATPVPEAAQWYDQGVAYLAAFEWLAAVRSFHKALRLDPALALAEIGVARSFVGLEALHRAHDHAQRAAAIDSSQRSQRDRDHVRLGVQQFAAIHAWARGDRRPHAAYKASLEEHLVAHPDDLSVAVLRGHAEVRPDGWGQMVSSRALPWYRRVVEAAPDHAPAHHAMVHVLEGLGRYQEAIPHADRFSNLAPTIPHAHHMRAHVLPMVGQWSAAKVALREADRLHRDRFARGTLRPAEDWHFGHNLRLFGALHQHLGRTDDARRAYDEAAAIGYGGRRAGFYCMPPVWLLLGQAVYEEALTKARACASLPSALGRVLGEAAASEALFALNQTDDARNALGAARRHAEIFNVTLRPDASDITFSRLASSALAVAETLQRRSDPAVTDTGIATDAEDNDLDREVDQELLTLASAFCGGRSVDAWALCQLRVDGLIAHAQRTGRNALAASLAKLVARP